MRAFGGGLLAGIGAGKHVSALRERAVSSKREEQIVREKVEKVELLA